MKNEYEDARELSRRGNTIFLWEDLNGILHYGTSFNNDGSFLVAKFVDGIDVMDGV